MVTMFSVLVIINRYEDINKFQPIYGLLSIKKISFYCEKCQLRFEVNTIKPIMKCIKCNYSKLSLSSGLTYEYVSSEAFKMMNPSVWKYIPNLIPDSDKIISLNEDYAYSLRKRLLNDNDMGKKKKTIDISTLYQHLKELENLGMIVRNTAESFRGKPIRFYYKITERGKLAATNKI